ncbi:MAG: dehydrogenase, partial [Planctomycetota bacterium]|nr:dehydrogenase [Planctomycetota bacterium]
MVTTLALLCIIFPEQNGDKSGEEQTAPYAEEELIAAPILSAEEQLQTFKLKQPYAIELVASEPLVFDPVIAMWDEQQRLWVVEMTSYMRDADGNNEDQANCCVAVIIDSNDDGKLDQRIEYLNDLILPRGIVPVKEGMLVLAPPNLLLCEDLDGDWVADRRTIIKSGFENAITVPEHAPNNMLRSIDNYIYLAKHNKRWQWKDGQLIEDGYTSASQWGLTEDLYGRKFYNHNSYPLFFDKLPANYFAGKSFDFKRQALQQAIATERPHPARL